MPKQIDYVGKCKIIGFSRPVFIYAIECAESGTVVYIGSTGNLIKSRIRAHIAGAKNGSHAPIHKWILEKDLVFNVRLLESVEENKREERERHWISQYENILNLTDGGKGLSGYSFAGTEHAEKIAKRLRTGQHFNCIKCGTEFWRKKKDIIKYRNKFCSRECSNARHKK